ncbi:MAG TPA: hypothetical protein VHY18_06430 [Solirubrobacteraceae bacterium]|jgi:hypothetical protein|nr:hypothetical protein [Solirubrobacteraceae bacterium]
MIVSALVIVWFAALAALVLRLAIVRRQRTGPESWERSPHLLDADRDAERSSFEQAIGEVMDATPAASSSKPATAEHVRHGAQEDLYVGP